MHAWKDTISEKVSRLFSNSQSNVEDQHPEVSSYPKEGKSLSSIFSFILPSPTVGKSGMNECIEDEKPIKLRSFEWKNEHFALRDETMNEHSDYDHETGHKASHENIFSEILSKDSTKQHVHVENGDPDSAMSNASDSPVYEDALDSPSFSSSMPNLKEESKFISPELYAFSIHPFQILSKVVNGSCCIGSMAKHGISLRTLIRKSGELSGPCLLVTRKAPFLVVYLNALLNLLRKENIKGRIRVLYSLTLYGAPVLFRPTGANRYFFLCMNDLLAIGGGTNFALRMDDDMLTRTSGPCETFGNSCLAHDQEFELKNVELWGFKHGSKYLT